MVKEREDLLKSEEFSLKFLSVSRVRLRNLTLRESGFSFFEDLFKSLVFVLMFLMSFRILFLSSG